MRALGCALFCACSFNGVPAAAIDATPTDSTTPDAPPSFSEWETPRAIIGHEVTGAQTYDDPVLLSNGRFYYCATDANGTEEIWVGNLDVNSATVLQPAPIVELNITSRQSVPWVNENERRMFLSQDTGDDGLLDIVFSRRSSTASNWGPPSGQLFTGINTANHDEAINDVGSDELDVIIVSNESGSFDLLRATRQENNVPFETAVPLPFQSDPALDELGGRISADGLTMTYNARSLSGENPPMDLYIARRSSVDVDFPVGQPIEELNTAQDENDLWITRDGLVAVFASDRGGAGLALFVTKREALTGR